MTRRHLLPLTFPAAALIAVALLPGCASQPAEPESAASQAVFFPGPPAPPRLQFLMTFDDGQMSTQGSTTFGDWIVGKEAPKRGHESTSIESPHGIAARNGKVYVCDVDRDRVHVVDFANHHYTTLNAGDQMGNPVNVVIDDDGTKYVCDTGRRVVHVFDANDSYVGRIGDPNTCTPIDLAIAGDVFYVLDIRDLEVEVWNRRGEQLRTFSGKGPGPDELSRPVNLDIGPEGYIYVTDMLQQIVKVFDPQGRLQNTIGGRGTNVGEFARPKGITIDRDNDVIYVADSQWDVVQAFNSKGNLLMAFGKPGVEPYAMGLPACLWIDRTSIDVFRRYIAPNFEPQYLLFLTNQFGRNKVVVYAFGRDRTLPADAYEVDTAKVEAIRAERRQAELEAQKQQQDNE